MATRKATRKRRRPSMRLLWTLAWRARCVWLAIRYPNRPGGHRLVGARCLCGHRVTDDPDACPVWPPRPRAAPRFTGEIVLAGKSLDERGWTRHEDDVFGVHWRPPVVPPRGQG